MSEISGQGYGDKHNWKKLQTAQVGSWGRKETLWQCNTCGTTFIHYYDEVPDIFQAMKDQKIPEECICPDCSDKIKKAMDS